MGSTIYSTEYYIKEWNLLHQHLVLNRFLNRNSLMADYCEEMITRAKDAYYNSGKAIMTDMQYDNFESKLITLRPYSLILSKVGS